MNQSIETLTKLRLLLEIDGIGSGKILNLLSKFESLDNLINASFSSLKKTEGISDNLALRIIKQIDDYHNFFKKIETEFEFLEKNNIEWMSFWSENYPQRLKNIYSPPIILYYKGKLTESDFLSISIVGTRTPTPYGKAMAERFSRELAENGLTVVSGLARGIDSIAHRSALNQGGRTLSIVGSGLDIIYPPENRKLFNDITDNGAVISEFKIGTKPDAQNFPKRNRIISGISLGTLVIETNVTGGALQTAGFALNQNREVFSIPGNLSVPQSAGTNLLIQRGEAKLVTNCEDILVELNLKILPEVGKNIPKPPDDLNLFEQKIFDVLSEKPKHIDKIATETNIMSSECLVHLLSLEFRELVKQLPGKSFVLSNIS